MIENPVDRHAFLASAMGQYLHRQVNEDDEQRAQSRIVGLLNGWRDAMGGREGIMSRNDGSELRGDELRVPPLPEARRSLHTKEHPLEHVTAPEQADHAIGMYHNLMIALDAMVMHDGRNRMRLHLTAEYVMIRALLEAASTALWILGPDDSDTRVTRALRLRHDELKHSMNLARTFARHSNTLQDSEFLSQQDYVNGQIEDLQTMAADAGLDPSTVTKNVTPSVIAVESGVYVPDLGGPLTYWYWSTASSLAHGEPANMRTLSDTKLIGVDHRNNPVGHVEPSETDRCDGSRSGLPSARCEGRCSFLARRAPKRILHTLPSSGHDSAS